MSGILSDGDRYLQYRAILLTSNTDSTPVLNDITISWDPLGIGETTEPKPLVIEFLPIVPNPTANSSNIRFTLYKTSLVDIYLFNMSGRLIDWIHGDECSIGFHEVLIGDLSPGIYFCRMISGEFMATQRFVVIE